MTRSRALLLVAVLLSTVGCGVGPQTGVWNEFIVFPLVNVLVLLYDFFLHDFGIAIVVLTIALRLALYPLFLQQLKSTRVQQELAPALSELRKKYKDDRQRFAEEQMKLYRERGFNPAAGCLPMLIQMPILFGLYSALTQVGCGLGQLASSTCPGLTAPELDSIRWPFVPNPVMGDAVLNTVSLLIPWGPGLAHKDPVFVWPIIAAACTFVSSMMMAPRQVAADDQTAKTMGMMQYYTPVITLIFGAQYAAGLSVYWTVTTLFSVFQQWMTSGWGKLATIPRIGPFLERRFPSPSAGAMKQEMQQAVQEAERDLRQKRLTEPPKKPPRKGRRR